MRTIRVEMGYSMQEFAELLGLKKSTYQGYESGRRPTPSHVMRAARDAQSRERRFFRDLPKRVDAALNGRPVPNDARSGEW